MAQNDASLKGPLDDAFQMVVAEGGGQYNSPKAVAANPSQLLIYFKSRATAKTKTPADVGSLAATNPGCVGATRGFNLWLSKVTHFIVNAKKI